MLELVGHGVGRRRRQDLTVAGTTAPHDFHIASAVRALRATAIVR